MYYLKPIEQREEENEEEGEMNESIPWRQMMMSMKKEEIHANYADNWHFVCTAVCKYKPVPPALLTDSKDFLKALECGGGRRCNTGDMKMKIWL